MLRMFIASMCFRKQPKVVLSPFWNYKDNKIILKEYLQFSVKFCEVDISHDRKKINVMGMYIYNANLAQDFDEQPMISP